LQKNPRVVDTGEVVVTPLGARSVEGFEYYPKQKHRWPSFVFKQGCKSPLSDNCLKVQVTSRWALNCFKPTYHELRRARGDDFEAVVNDLILREIPACTLAGEKTGAEQEIHRRISMAVALLMNSEGIPVPYPASALFPRPARAQQISQPWLRALVTGHI
jgi:hypothetical protein